MARSAHGTGHHRSFGALPPSTRMICQEERLSWVRSRFFRRLSPPAGGDSVCGSERWGSFWAGYDDEAAAQTLRKVDEQLALVASLEQQINSLVCPHLASSSFLLSSLELSDAKGYEPLNTSPLPNRFKFSRSSR